MVNLRSQKRLAASVASVGQRKIWLDPAEQAENGNANARMQKISVSKKNQIFKVQLMKEKKEKEVHKRTETFLNIQFFIQLNLMRNLLIFLHQIQTFKIEYSLADLSLVQNGTELLKNGRIGR